jgi:hypothetical protein
VTQGSKSCQPPMRGRTSASVQPVTFDTEVSINGAVKRSDPRRCAVKAMLHCNNGACWLLDGGRS